MQFIPSYIKKLAAHLLPYTCVLCSFASARGQDLCEACYQELPESPQSCPRCAIPMVDLGKSSLCSQCIQETPPFDILYSLYLYQMPVSKLILDLKFKKSLVNARVLGELLLQKIRTSWYSYKPLPQVIVPVPLHPQRLQERGFNQALEIARPIGKALQLPIDSYSCLRNRPTLAQATLLASMRPQNVRNAFTIRKDFSPQHVVVIDDVVTTANTIMEFCKALKKNGASQIDVWCCARPCLIKVS